MTDPLSDYALDNLRPNGLGRQIRLRASPVEDETFKRAAKLAGLTISAWVRMACRQQAAEQLKKIGEDAPWV